MSPVGNTIELDPTFGTDNGDRSIWAKNLVAAKRKKGKGAPAEVDLEKAITNIRITDTIHGSSAIVITIYDEDWELTDSGFFDANSDGRLDAIDVNYPEDSKLWWRCTQIGSNATRVGVIVTMTFMERAAVHLMQHHGPLKISRAKRTRAQAMKMLASKVKAGGGITFHSKNLDIRQPIDRSVTGAVSGRIVHEGDSLAQGTATRLTDLNKLVSTRAASGRTSGQGVADLAGNKAPNLVVSLGTNDTDLSAFRSNIRKIVGRPEVKRVFWVNISRPTMGGTTDIELNEVLTAEAARSAKLDIIDWWTAVDTGKVILPDDIHPNSAGYEYRAQMIAKALRGDREANLEKRREDREEEKSREKRREDKDAGIPLTANLMIARGKASQAQLKEVNTALRVAAAEKASERVMLAVLCAGIGESAFRPVVNSLGYGGVFQGQVNTGGRYFSRFDTSAQARCLLRGGKGFNTGLIKLAKQHPDWSIGHLVYVVEGSAPAPGFSTSQAEAHYNSFRAEAEALLKAWGGADAEGGAAGDGDAGEYTKQYNFQVGDDKNPRQTYWDAMQDWADEVKWALFLDGQHLWFDPETTLIKQEPVGVVRRNDPALLKFDCNWDMRQIATECTIDLLCDPFEFRAGEVFLLENLGAASTGSTANLPGRWLIEEIERDRFELYSTFRLKQPTSPDPEPASQRVQRQRKEDEEETDTTGKVSGSAANVINRVVLPIAKEHGVNRTVAENNAANARHGPTSDGDRSDHQGPPATVWAADLPCTGATGDKLARALAKRFQAPHDGHRTYQRWDYNGYNFQIIWKADADHFDHVHIGVRKTGKPSSFDSKPRRGPQGLPY